MVARSIRHDKGGSGLSPIYWHGALKILALSFLITIGVTIFMEGLHQHVPKAYIYLPMGFALFVEVLQMRYEYHRNRNSSSTAD